MRTAPNQSLDGMEHGSAEFSADGLYRYVLRRRWREDLPHVLWVMLNPSTADAEIDDATMRRVLGFSMDRGYGSVTVVNVFALISTDPLGLLKAADPVGPKNDIVLAREAAQTKTVICAWGSQRRAHHARIRAVRQLLRVNVLPDARVLCLGTNADRSPRHPVRLPTSTTLFPFELGGTDAPNQ